MAFAKVPRKAILAIVAAIVIGVGAVAAIGTPFTHFFGGVTVTGPPPPALTTPCSTMVSGVSSIASSDFSSGTVGIIFHCSGTLGTTGAAALAVSGAAVDATANFCGAGCNPHTATATPLLGCDTVCTQYTDVVLIDFSVTADTVNTPAVSGLCDLSQESFAADTTTALDLGNGSPSGTAPPPVSFSGTTAIPVGHYNYCAIVTSTFSSGTLSPFDITWASP